MNDRRHDSHPSLRPFRVAALALAALVVLSLGFAMVPAEKPAPAVPSFSEQARAAALTDALELRAAGQGLTADGAVDSTTVDAVVTLLTIQARALQSPSPEAGAQGSGSPSPASATPAKGAAEVVQALAASGRARIRDASEADGGLARLLAGTGTAQLLAAGRLAAAAGLPAPQGTAPLPDADASGAAASASPCVAPPATAAAPESTGSGAPAGARQALAAVTVAEQQAIYAYQAALPRLAPAEAGPASEFLGQHKGLAASAEARFRRACGVPVPQQPGYILDGGFLAAPVAGLGRIEASTLAAYGDAVALTQGQDRAWALGALESTAVRAARWGADPGPVPGLILDVGQLPALRGGESATASPTPS
ncbi:DUF4439 domain-containing protein [Pseudarthrobacter sp. AG30]|uniref:DUF4439 domain-containing protein n=1 Tax=Pseudarthrobacter sp. AG30 TaxID=2249742 RepID=UPI000D6597B4|nr:DUF4439 domain-containing protein [Pseudarthrobacter sp. AG30]RAX17421.1 DUF4439 domain-containing protein [Pseudarthrobacter sp. AG30]